VQVVEQLKIRRITAYCLLGVCFVTALLVVANLHTPVRTIAVLLFVGTAPGWALISYVNVRHLSVTWISAVGLSLSVSLVVAQVLVLTHAWHPEAAVIGMVIGTAALLVHHVLRSRPRSVS
jgi:ABC-type iron transport system FetAB permease component